jgi:hypothetical protein
MSTVRHATVSMATRRGTCHVSCRAGTARWPSTAREGEVPDPDGLADRWKWSGGVGGVCTSVLKRGEAEEIRGVGSWVRLTTNGCYSLAPPTTVCAAFRRTRIVSLRPCPCFLCWLAKSFVPMFFLSCKNIIFPTYICEGGRSDAGGSFRAPQTLPPPLRPPHPPGLAVAARALRRSGGFRRGGYARLLVPPLN